MKIRILGSGTSSGVPRIGNDWGDCDPNEPRNRRTRASVLVSTATTRILVDTGPDMREQLIAAGVTDLDAVIWTHDHADHCHGIDDLRQLMHLRGRPVRGLARPFTMASLRRRFSFVFEGRGGYRTMAEIEELPDHIRIGDIDVRVVDQPHGGITSAGIRFHNSGKSIVYSTDFNDLTDDMKSVYKDADLWVVDALRRKPHPTHAHLAATLEWIGACGVRSAVLTHMDQSMDYATLCAELPAHVRPGYDGLEIAP